MNDEVIIKNDLIVEEYNYLREEVNWNKKNPDFIKMAIENSTIVKKSYVKRYNCRNGQSYWRW